MYGDDMKFEDKLDIAININKYIPGKTINTITQKDEVIIDGVVFKVGSFLSEQRKIYAKYERMVDDSKKSKEVLEHFKLLEEAGFDFNPKETDWYKKYNALRKYYDDNGNIDVVFSYKMEYEGEIIPLGVFVTNQRVVKRRYNEGKVKEDPRILEHFKLLDELGMNWDPQLDDFDRKIRGCKKYLELYGNLDVPESFVIDVDGEKEDIGVFITNQRRLHGKYLLGSVSRGERSKMVEHFKILEDLGIDWDPMETQWLKKYQLLKDFRERNGHLNIKVDYQEEIDDEVINLGLFLDDQRSLYRRYSNKLDQIDSKYIKRFKMLEELGIDWEPRETYWQIRYELCCKYKEVIGNVNIPYDYEVVVGNEVIRLGSFLRKQRELYREYESNGFANCSDNVMNRFKMLEDLGVVWNVFDENFKFQYKYLEDFYNLYGHLNIPLDYEVIDNGEVIKVGVFARNIKAYMSERKEDILNGEASIKLMLRYSMLKDIGFKFTVPVDTIKYDLGDGVKQFTKKELSKQLNIPYNTFRKYLDRFNGNVTKTVRIYNLNKSMNEKRKDRKNKNTKLSTVLETFDVNMDRLNSYLSKKALVDGVKRDSNVVMYSGEETLRKFCNDHGYNYGVIIRAFRLIQKKLVEEDFETIINRVLIDYNKNGQNRPPSWVYSKYGNSVLVSHFLLSLRLDPSAVIRDMGNNCITIEEAIENNIFKMENNKKRDYLEGLYHEVIAKYNELNTDSSINSEMAIDAIVEYIRNIVNEYSLSQEEYELVVHSFYRYVTTINKYHIYDVGFEKNSDKRAEKIKKYVLDDEEIKESFFVPLKFNEKVLIGRDSELYKRRLLIKSLIDEWDNLTSYERTIRIEKLKLTDDEEKFINKYFKEFNNDINNVVKK